MWSDLFVLSQLHVIHLCRQGPRQPSRLGTIERFRYRTARHPATSRDLPV
jgi:hypothetical protein